WFSACSSDSGGGCGGGGGGGSGGVSLGKTLTLSGQVKTIDFSLENGETLVDFTGSSELKAGCKEDNNTWHFFTVGTGKVENGQFNFTIGEPKPEEIPAPNKQEILSVLLQLYANFKFSPSTVKIAELDFAMGADGKNGTLLREKRPSDQTKREREEVVYFYVDRDVTITGTGKTTPEMNTTTKNINLSLKAGWNAVYVQREANNMTLSMGNPSHLQWVWRGRSSGGGTGIPDPGVEP
ncbi:MAG: hypothetical protein FWD91_00170, partial [Treponema sp.]|nr:hypothetical protein [Treponema sp.]